MRQVQSPRAITPVTKENLGIAEPTAVVITRTNGVITQITETVAGLPRVTTFTRTSGVITQIVTTYDGKTVTETLTRTNGVITGITRVES